MCDHDKHLHSNTGKEKSHSPSAKITDAHHNEEHNTWNRRSFLQALGLIGGGTIMVGGANLTASVPSRLTAALANSANNGRILLLIRLKGGNDGLNTIVPIYDYDFYAQNRPTIKHELSDLYQLSPDFGIPPSMQSLQSLWGDGKMKVVQGVGYPDQNLSHFRSSDIWASADAVNVESTGVFGRYFEDIYPDYLINPPAEPPAIQIGSIGNLLFDGLDTTYAFSVANPEQLASIAENGVLHDVLNIPGCTYGDQLGFMRGMTNTTFTYAGVINEAYEAADNAVDYGDSSFAKQLKIVARMIKGGLGTQVYMVTLSGFDTHANQVEDHDNLMLDLSTTVKAFYDDLATVGRDHRVIGMTFSEFGRRIEENGSNGTDHGAASPVMMFGSKLDGNGFIGSQPDLQSPDGNGNLQFGTDFRSIYATVLKEWLCIDAALVDEILLDGGYDTLDLGFNCSNLSTPDFGTPDGFFHLATYQNQQTYLEFTLPSPAKIHIELYNIIGQKVGTINNDFLLAGPHKIDIKQAIQKRLFTGQYIYRINYGGKAYSKSILIK